MWDVMCEMLCYVRCVLYKFGHMQQHERLSASSLASQVVIAKNSDCEAYEYDYV